MLQIKYSVHVSYPDLLNNFDQTFTVTKILYKFLLVDNLINAITH